MNSSRSQARGRRALTGAAVAALGTMLALAPAASAMADTSGAQGQDSVPAIAQPAAAQPDVAQSDLAPTVGDNDPDLGALGVDHDWWKSHEHGNKAIVICEFCQVAQGNIINAPKIIIIKHHHEH